MESMFSKVGSAYHRRDGHVCGTFVYCHSVEMGESVELDESVEFGLGNI